MLAVVSICVCIPLGSSACVHVSCPSVMLSLLSLNWLSGIQHPCCTLSSLPSDRLTLCQERMIVFESCQDIKRGRSPTRDRVNNKLATTSKVRGNMTSQSASLIGSGLPCCEGMDGSCFSALLLNPFCYRGKPFALSQFHVTYEYYRA